MIQTNQEPYRVPGYVQTELIVGFGLVALLVLGLLYTVNPLAGDDEGGGSIPAYRSANAMYIYNSIERQRVALSSYYDLYGELPGDSSVPMEIDGRRIVGNANGKIEVPNHEKDKVFPELFQSGVAPVKIARIRGKVLELSWVTLKDGDKVLGTGHFFKIPGVHPLEARSYDLKYDDASSDSGDVFYARNPEEGVDLYIKLELYK